MHRLFLAHPKDHEGLPQLVEQVMQLLVRMNVPAGCEVVTGERDFHVNFQRFGGWGGWVHSVVHGHEYAGNTLVPRYSAILVAPYTDVGRATAQIVEGALHAHKPVFYYNPVEEAVQPVVGVWQTRRGDYRTGWALAFPPLATEPLSRSTTG